MKHSISYDAKKCKHDEHREDLHHCPNCNHMMDYAQWDKAVITLVLSVVQHKHDSGVIISECPKCFKNSWIHMKLDHLSDTVCKMYGWPKKYHEKAEEEYNRRHSLSVEELQKSLCISCKNLCGIKIETSCHIECKIHKTKFGVEVKCEEYEDL